jgi:eukaryotic-like serine/threonine-protein kinase
MHFFKINSWWSVLKHMSVTLGIGVMLVLFFFYVYLPNATNHGESITVPNLEGMMLNDLNKFVLDRDMRYEVSDSSYSSDFPAYTVLHQFPKAGSKVKVNRKIFITLNSKNPPTTVMPNLVDKTVQNAELILKSYELKRGRITTEPDAFRNVLAQKYLNDTIQPGTKIAKGSEIDLIIGDGHGITQFEMPPLLGLPLEEAEIIIKGNSLNVGIVFNNDAATPLDFVVIKQSPNIGETVRVSSEVNIWLGDALDLPSDTTIVEQ